MLHPTSEIKTKNIGEGTTVWQYCVILEGATIGKNCNINYNVFIENDVLIGDNVTIKPGVQLWDGMRVANNVFIGPNVTFVNDNYPRSKNYPKEFLQTLILEGASIGAGSIILGGLTIGKYALIGAGSIVTKNIPNHTLYFGNPARSQGYICKCGEKLDVDFCCKKCNLNYLMKNGQLEEKND